MSFTYRLKCPLSSAVVLASYAVQCKPDISNMLTDRTVLPYFNPIQVWHVVQWVGFSPQPKGPQFDPEFRFTDCT